MSGKDKFTVEIACSGCGNFGTIKVWQKDGYAFMRDGSTYIDSVPSGFVATEPNYNLGDQTPVKCVECDLLVKNENPSK